MGEFLLPGSRLESTYTMFALGASYVEDVVEAKHEFDTLAETFPEDMEPMKTVLGLITDAEQLQPLTKDEIHEILQKLQEFHGRAYGWEHQVSVEELAKATQTGGYLLRTKIRAAIEFLDQMYQYGQAGEAVIGEMETESFEEEIPVLAEEEIV